MLLLLAFTLADIIFHKFLELHSTLSEKRIFVTNFPFLMDLLKLVVVELLPRLTYEMRTQTSVDNKVDDLHYEIKFETKITFSSCETLLFFLEQKFILFSEKYFFTIPTNLITSAFFLPRQIIKNIDMPRQKPQMLLW